MAFFYLPRPWNQTLGLPVLRCSGGAGTENGSGALLPGVSQGNVLGVGGGEEEGREGEKPPVTGQGGKVLESSGSAGLLGGFDRGRRAAAMLLSPGAAQHAHYGFCSAHLPAGVGQQWWWVEALSHITGCLTSA